MLQAGDYVETNNTLTTAWEQKLRESFLGKLEYSKATVYTGNQTKPHSCPEQYAFSENT